VLAARGARYRAGAPLDPHWLAGGEYARQLLRSGILERPIGESHRDLVALATRLLPPSPP